MSVDEHSTPDNDQQYASGAPRTNGAAEPASKWPAHLGPDAYQGLLGEIVNAIAPHTEADPAAILSQSLVAFGALVGRVRSSGQRVGVATSVESYEGTPGPFYKVEGDRHFANLYGVNVGPTAKGRKGTAWGRVRQIFSRVEGWPKPVDGLSSGEGLKYRVRDAGPVRGAHDTGVLDKRLLVTEAEFASALRQAARNSNTLSSTIRAAWDTGDLMNLTKNDPTIATGAHVSIIGHITRDELRAELTATDAANGFANRFLFFCVKRSQSLPFGGSLAEDVIDGLAQKIKAAAAHARTLGEVPMTPAARDLWVEEYTGLSAGLPGLLGAVTGRAEAQVVRLALVYALADSAREIDIHHLKAGLEVWRYCADSARYVFGTALGDPVADKILGELFKAKFVGLTRTQISALFSGNQDKVRIEASLTLLADTGCALKRERDSGGRPAEVWIASCYETNEGSAS